ncbi:pyocin activator PrtN family protein [Acinetobacter sp. LoGeW2-3]|uniref:pyocin activator PrtN family protein n=1 Tax=Acinetobacter sp. LoGeW2-3 TaxID=1808001 RepID=UPI001D18305C
MYPFKKTFNHLPFPALKIEQSAKVPLMVRLKDFAIYLDRQNALHRQVYDSMNS